MYWNLKDSSGRLLGNNQLILVALDETAPTFPDPCPFTPGEYNVRTSINKAGRLAVGGCFVADNGSVLEVGSEEDCTPATCNDVSAVVINNGETCSVEIFDCFSNVPGNGEPTSLTLSYGNFDVTVSFLVCMLGDRTNLQTFNKSYATIIS